MKKFLIILTFLISTIFFIDNVSAKTYEIDTDLFGTVTVDIDTLISGNDLTGNFILTKNSNENNLVLIFESNDETLWFTGRFTNMSGSRYINTYYSNYNSTTGTWSAIQSSSTYGITTKYTNIYYTNIDTIPVYNTSINMKYDENTGIYFENNDTSRGDLICVGTSGGGYLAYKNENTKLIEFYYNNTKSYSFSYETYPYYFVDSAGLGNCEFNYSTEEFYYNTTTGYNTSKTTSYWIRPQNNSTTNSSSKISQNPIVYSSFDWYTENGELYYSSSTEITPTISITKESETSVTILEKEYITDVTLKIDFGTINNEKYLYMYKYGIDSDWTTVTLTENTYITKTYSENNTLYVQILSKDDYSVVTSNSFTVSSINYDFTPYITIDEITSDSCILGEYTICQSLQINSHIADFKKYSFVIIDHTQNTTEKYTKEMTVYKTYYTNSTIEVRIIENETNNIFQTISFTISTINEETDNLGQYIKQECYFASIGNNYLCNYYFYNYEPDTYQYYYGTSTSEFEELKLETGTESVFDKTIYKLKNGLGILKEISYSENTTVYFKVLNKETGELIHTQTFVISYDKKLEESGKKDLFDIFKNFNNDNKTIKDIIDNIWNSIKTSSIYEYIMILIVGTLIIVVIKAANR